MTDDDKKKHTNDTVGSKARKEKWAEQERKNPKDPVEEWKCPKCGRKFGNLNKESVPKDHLCPYDHTDLKRVR